MRRRVWGGNRPFPGIAGTLAALVAIAVIALLAGWLAPQGKPLSGHPEIVDGDTLRFGSTRVRLTGIDAPELDQTCTDANGADYACGAEAKRFVVDFIGGDETSCARSGRDRYGRVLASCSTGGRDLGRAIADAGWAVAELDYAFAALPARAARRGIWQGPFEDPAAWRRDHGTSEPGWWEWIGSLFQ
jgi:endonuclease YncB( thermonuclease family)